jgi:hypothetical protein
MTSRMTPLVSGADVWARRRSSVSKTCGSSALGPLGMIVRDRQLLA